MSKETAIVWLMMQLEPYHAEFSTEQEMEIYDLFLKAKEMEKQQIVQAWNQRAITLDGEAYYKHTFGVKA
jgi:hypothetical protein